MVVTLTLEDGTVIGQTAVREGALWRGLVVYCAEQLEHEVREQQQPYNRLQMLLDLKANAAGCDAPAVDKPLALV